MSTKRKEQRTSWPMVRVSPQNHAALRKAAAMESGKQGKPISLVDFSNRVVGRGLKALGYSV